MNIHSGYIAPETAERLARQHSTTLAQLRADGAQLDGPRGLIDADMLMASLHRPMTFADFQATRRDNVPLFPITRDEQHENSLCIAYAGDAYIEQLADGRYMLILYREQYITPSTSLEMMEAFLYAWCLTEAPDGMGVDADVQMFIYRLQHAMGDENFARAMLANRDEQNPNVCHMHDYCDAGQVALDVAGVDRADDLYHRARPFLRGGAA